MQSIGNKFGVDDAGLSFETEEKAESVVKSKLVDSRLSMATFGVG